MARLTERCDLRCAHCLAGAAAVVTDRGTTGTGADGVDGVGAGAGDTGATAAGSMRGDLPLGAWREILAELPAIDAHKVLLTGGEPLLFEGLVELTAFVSDMGVTTDLNSNLQRLTPQLAGDLAAAGLTEASVSLEGPAAVHDRLHGVRGAHARLTAGIAMLREAGVTVDGSLCVTPANLTHVEGAIAKAAHLGLASFTVSGLLPVGHGQRERVPTVPETELALVHERLAAARAGFYGIPVRCVGLLGAPAPADCGQGRSLVGIHADGALASCVLSRDTIADVPAPRAVGLAAALPRLREGMRAITPRMCYGETSS